MRRLAATLFFIAIVAPGEIPSQIWLKPDPTVVDRLKPDPTPHQVHLKPDTTVGMAVQALSARATATLHAQTPADPWGFEEEQEDTWQDILRPQAADVLLTTGFRSEERRVGKECRL